MERDTCMEEVRMDAYESFGLSDKGSKERNEDAFLAANLDGTYVFAVAEGMGGRKDGPSAAQFALEAMVKGGVARKGKLSETLEGLMGRAENALYTMETDVAGIESPVVVMAVAIADPDGRCVVSSPASRKVFFLARNRAGTQDDSPPGTSGHFVLYDPGAGMHEAILPEGFLVLCSDGITDFVPDSRIQEIVAELGNDLEEACKRLLHEAFQNGSDDNLTVVLVRRRDS